MSLNVETVVIFLSLRSKQLLFSLFLRLQIPKSSTMIILIDRASLSPTCWSFSGSVTSVLCFIHIPLRAILQYDYNDVFPYWFLSVLIVKFGSLILVDSYRNATVNMHDIHTIYSDSQRTLIALQKSPTRHLWISPSKGFFICRIQNVSILYSVGHHLMWISRVTNWMTGSPIPLSPTKLPVEHKFLKRHYWDFPCLLFLFPTQTKLLHFLAGVKSEDCRESKLRSIKTHPGNWSSSNHRSRY